MYSQNDIQMVQLTKLQVFHSFTESGLSFASVIRKVYTAVSMQLAPAMEALLRTLADVHSEDGSTRMGRTVRFTGIFIILIGDAFIKRIPPLFKRLFLFLQGRKSIFKF